MSEMQVIIPLVPSFPLLWRGPGSDDGDPARPQPDHAGSSGSPRKTRVFIIDDESSIADTLVEILGDEGFEAASAANGEAALRVIESFRPDIVISDVVIPGINGVEVGIRIRELLPQCRVILFSGQAATVDLLKKARERGHEFEILAKPLRPETLIAVIRATGRSQAD